MHLFALQLARLDKALLQEQQFAPTARSDAIPTHLDRQLAQRVLGLRFLRFVLVVITAASRSGSVANGGSSQCSERHIRSNRIAQFVPP